MRGKIAAIAFTLLLGGLGAGLIGSSTAVAGYDPPGGGTGSPKPPHAPGGDGFEPSGR